ncbi:MAG: GIY-YIG nuclease family protein [Bdellovibrio sp.]|nr:GIY-YIG nuclease family protein [Bdellovibrio sp.]
MAKKKKSLWDVYIIETKSGRYYTGISLDMHRRFLEHKNDRQKKAKFFRSDTPLKIIYSEQYATRSEALKREYQIKQLSKTKKNMLIKAIKEHNS